jgi:hydroxymethylglutaryl-CoA lyase
LGRSASGRWDLGLDDMNFPTTVKIVEVGPRDGLQNESMVVSTEDKVRFINMLTATGLSVVEVTSFVSPKWVPQLADAAEVFRQIDLREGVRYPVLTPNSRGLERALESGAKEVAFFTAASETFNKKNLNMSVRESLAEIREMAATGKSKGLWMRGYVSTAFYCPYQGRVAPDKIRPIVEELLDFGIDEISIGDTIGWATPGEVTELTEALRDTLPLEKWAYHFHDTRGTALANVLMAMSHGIHIFDSSAGGLGGCPFAPGAAGNLATEDFVYMLNGMGIATGVDMDKLVDASRFIGSKLGRALLGKYLGSHRQ